MRTFLKVVAVSSALLVAAQAVPAAAGDRHGDDMLAAGVAGLAAGVIAGAIVSGSNDGPREVQTYEEVPQYRQRPVYYSGGDYGYRPVRQNRIQPWTRDWYQLCEDRYDSFDPQTGTYIDGYGNERFCKIR
ncbi:BA14K family protein [Rhizobium sp. C1]|uniref:BA14K family protein n=1 Tax=Rhizobium sp. C1 TaxID=1349799 RepID=UPI001E528E97|nr:BA14K family protein [Rhizobium sp. C1]MCD2178245.1 BA14K family protein [Rhizobium sp. C1]